MIRSKNDESAAVTQDNGFAIARRQFDRIADRFGSTRRRGTYFGLPCASTTSPFRSGWTMARGACFGDCGFNTTTRVVHSRAASIPPLRVGG